jgi:hypothetical protein
MIEKLDADFDCTRVTFADRRLEIEEQFFATRVIEFS